METDGARPKTGDTGFLETVTESLSNPERRSILRVLRERSESTPLPVERLAAELVARDRDVPTDAVTVEQADRRRTMLYHCHLPKLHRAAVIDWDREESRVALADRPRVREALSTLLAGPESRRSSPGRKWGNSKS